MEHGRPILLALALFALSGCQPLPQPFAHHPDARGHVIEPPMEFGGVAVLPVSGAPDETARGLAASLAEALARHEIPAAPGSGNQRSRFVQGSATARPEPGGRISVEIIWDLFDRGGTVLATHRHRETIPAADWHDASGGAMRALTRDAATDFAMVIHGTAGQPAATIPLPLHVWPVDGAPDGDDARLRRAMEAALRRRDFTIVPDLDGARLVIAGALTVGPAGADPMPVAIVWSVLDTDGRELGQLAQQNAVPAAALSSGWNTLATVIAENAAEGLADLLHRLPPEALHRARAGGN